MAEDIKPSKSALVKSCFVFTFLQFSLGFLSDYLFEGDEEGFWYYRIVFALFWGFIPAFIILFFYNILLMQSIPYVKRKDPSISSAFVEIIFIVGILLILNLVALEGKDFKKDKQAICRFLVFNLINIFTLVGSTRYFRFLSLRR